MTFDPQQWFTAEQASISKQFRWPIDRATRVITQDILLDRYRLRLSRVESDQVLDLLSKEPACSS